MIYNHWKFKKLNIRKPEITIFIILIFSFSLLNIHDLNEHLQSLKEDLSEFNLVCTVAHGWMLPYVYKSQSELADKTTK